jgi:hypothetical protein
MDHIAQVELVTNKNYHLLQNTYIYIFASGCTKSTRKYEKNEGHGDEKDCR